MLRFVVSRGIWNGPVVYGSVCSFDRLSYELAGSYQNRYCNLGFLLSENVAQLPDRCLLFSPVRSEYRLSSRPEQVVQVAASSLEVAEKVSPVGEFYSGHVFEYSSRVPGKLSFW